MGSFYRFHRESNGAACAFYALLTQISPCKDKNSLRFSKNYFPQMCAEHETPAITKRTYQIVKIYILSDFAIRKTVFLLPNSPSPAKNAKKQGI
jgi:hypothetical protein